MTTKLTYAGESIDGYDGYLDDIQLTKFLSTFPKECCAKCRFWDKHELPVFNHKLITVIEQAFERLGARARADVDDWVPVSYVGDCRRRSPMVYALTTLQDGAAPEDALFPKTSYCVWCGDFEARPPTGR